MKKRVILVCEEKSCSTNTIDKVVQISKEEKVSEVNCLKVIPHPPMQFCEHGGADREEDEKALDMENRAKQGEWISHEEEIHGGEMKDVVERLKEHGVDDVKIKFLVKEIGFGSTLTNELIDGRYDVAVMTDHLWDQVDGKKVPAETKVITVANISSEKA